MSANMRRLADLPISERCRVVSLISQGSDRRRMLDLGIVPGTEIEAVLSSPTGGVTAYLIRGVLIAIRYEDAINILIETELSFD